MINITEILNKSEKLSYKEIIALLSSKSDVLHKLYSKAETIKKTNLGNKTDIWGLLEFSNYCDQDCDFCKFQSENLSINKFRFETEQIVEFAQVMIKSNIKTIILSSGLDHHYDSDEIAYIVYSIKQHKNVKVFLSLGLRDLNDYRKWKIAGADGYICKHLTINGRMYQSCAKNKSLIERMKHIKYLNGLGYKIGAGCIIGVPSQSLDDLTNDIYFLNQLDVSTVFFMPYLSLNLLHKKEEILIKKQMFDLAAVTRILYNQKSIAFSIDYEKYIEKNVNNFRTGENIIMLDFTSFFLNKRKFSDEFNSLSFQLSSPE